MRRKDKEITDRERIDSIIGRSSVCRLAMSDDNQPYIVALCFGYRNNTLYFHCASEGKKIDILRNNNRVCFQFDVDSAVIKSDKACQWGMKYESVIGFGKAYFVEEPESKQKALGTIMKQYSDESFEYPQAAVDKTVVIKVDIDRMTGKVSAPD